MINTSKLKRKGNTIVNVDNVAYEIALKQRNESKKKKIKEEMFNAKHFLEYANKVSMLERKIKELENKVEQIILDNKTKK